MLKSPTRWLVDDQNAQKIVLLVYPNFSELGPTWNLPAIKRFDQGNFKMVAKKIDLKMI